jgi:hypothetical protein
LTASSTMTALPRFSSQWRILDKRRVVSNEFFDNRARKKPFSGREKRAPKRLPHAGLNRRPLDCMVTVERSTN